MTWCGVHVSFFLGAGCRFALGILQTYCGQVKCSCVIVQSATQAGQHHHFNSGSIPRSHHWESCTFSSGVMQISMLSININ